MPVPALLGPSDVHIWYRDTRSMGSNPMADASAQAALALLSAEERARHDRFVVAGDRRDFAEAHALIRRVLSSYEDVPPVDWEFESTADGKPFLARGRFGAGPLAFSLSHTRGLVACAVTRGADVGLDVELIDRPVNAREIAGRFFTPAEDAAIQTCPEGERRARFIELWTLKEAYIKAIGRGLACPLDAFGVALGGSHDIRFEAPPDVNAEEWHFALFAPLPHARMAVAVWCGASREHRVVARQDQGGGGETLPIRQSAPRERAGTPTKRSFP